MSDSGLRELLNRHFAVEQVDADVLRQMAGMVRDWLAPEGKSPYPVTPIDDLLPLFADLAPPASGMAPGQVLEELQRKLLPHTARLNHPKYIGHMTQALPWMTVLVEALAAALNQNQVKIETAYASTLVEKQILGWMHRVVYLAPDAVYVDAMRAKHQALGNIVNGGTMGNLTALAVALEHALPGVRKHGVYAAMQQSGQRGMAVIASARAHYSLKKALGTLGLGEDALHRVPVDADNRIDLVALEETIAALKRDRIRIVAIVGIAGTTETGAIDPLAALAAIARREHTWFHVDAAWGGALLMAERFRSLYAGIEAADSVVIDGHKLFWVAMAQGMVLFRDQASLDLLKHNANYIIRSNSGDLGQTSLEGSRRFDALKLWVSFKLLGEGGYATLLDHAAGLAAAMRELIAAQPDFELTSNSDNFILTYRYLPPALGQRLAQLLAAGSIDEAIILNRQVNELNARLQERQKANGHSFVSRTVLERAPFAEGITVLRVVLSNVYTTPAHLGEIIAEQRQLGALLAAC
ncbi:glutamate decarboxylase [Duganella sp. 3397]|uniref:aminotransferase class V-fold PLP-dependent enzyme n=1 Tax=Duganella sp. 3397 TaxID=2817732 RepID=UPI00285902A1|nr:aminotransferase class V-fold PLP-dependent enzyme [Duganella sp. 3397]MDR7048976.1 glutamate decarboxylase [Duganella sp. 3397]